MIPTTADVERITAIGNPVIRNLQITHCYWLLSTAIAARTGAAANWCTFAQWASRQAGASIRAEDLGDTLRRRLGGGFVLLHPIRSVWRMLLRRGLLYPSTRLGRLVRAIHSPFDAFERASDAVARGNRKVFEEIGWIFAAYLQDCPDGAVPGSTEFRRFLTRLRDGDPPDGQKLLAAAFEQYASAASAGTGAERSQRIFWANLLIGWHEQTRLQPEIQEALESPAITAEDLGRRLFRIILPGRIVPRLLARIAGGILAPFARFSRAITRAVITERLMTLSFPERHLRLSEHLDAKPPESLALLNVPGLAALASEFEPENCSHCGAQDWSDLGQRMHFIFHLFRCLQEEAALAACPFNEKQIKAFLDGRIPSGDL